MRRLRLFDLAGVLALALVVLSLWGRPKVGEAMPNFAVAYGVPCSLCHTQVPLLNAYGRYVQRTGYASLDRDAMKATLPLWLGESSNYNSTAGAGTGAPRTTLGNIAIHGAGYVAPDFTFHLHQWITQGNQPGGVDTLWVTYNNLFHRDGHLFVGKILNPAPSPYSQNFEIDGPSASATVVGEHNWGATYNNRWGTKFAYTHGAFNVEAGYLLSADDLNGITDFAPGDKTFQWKIAYARPTKPVEFGIFGSNGNVPVSTGTDVYSSAGAYLQIDPTGKYMPGLILIHHIGHDGNAGADASGNVLGSSTSRGTSLGIYEHILREGATLGFRHDMNSDGLGTLTNGNAVNLGFSIGRLRFVHGFIEANLGGNSSLAGTSGGPTWKGMLWLTLPAKQ